MDDSEYLLQAMDEIDDFIRCDVANESIN